MDQIKESDIPPARRDGRLSGSNEPRRSYQRFTCPACGEHFASRASGFACCPNCTNPVPPYYMNLSNVSPSNTIRPRQSAVRTSIVNRRRSTHPDPRIFANRYPTERPERQLPSIRDVPILRRALEVPAAREPARQGHGQQYLSPRGDRDGMLDLPVIRARPTAQYDRGAEHHERPMLPDPREPCSQSRTNQHTGHPGHRSQGYPQYYDEES